MKTLASVLLSLFTSLVVNAASADSSTRISIPHLRKEVNAGLILHRTVKYRVPDGTPPREGWPAVLLFQGTNHPVEFERDLDAEYGLYHEARLIQNLLERGFAVLAPDAIFRVGWVTNVATVGYDLTSDAFFLKNILAEIEAGSFGAIDKNRLFAAGISSGGYQTSRMAISFPGKFRALAVHSGAYATCLGRKCRTPEKLPADHPPTLLLYGTGDKLVPRWTVDAYAQALESNQIPSKLWVDQKCGHEYCEKSPETIIDWFESYL